MKGGALPEDAAVDFIGDCAEYRGQKVTDIARALNISKRVAVRGRVPIEEGRRLLRSASGLLLLAQNQPLQVPQKLYDYLEAGRPILAYADRDGETAQMLRGVGGHVVITGDDPMPAIAALEVIMSPDPTRGPSSPLPPDWITENTMEELASIIERVGVDTQPAS